MDMVGCHHIVQYGETEPLLCLENSAFSSQQICVL
jgi:hypothetical protein